MIYIRAFATKLLCTIVSCFLLKYHDQEWGGDSQGRGLYATSNLSILSMVLHAQKVPYYHETETLMSLPHPPLLVVVYMLNICEDFTWESPKPDHTRHPSNQTNLCNGRRKQALLSKSDDSPTIVCNVHMSLSLREVGGCSYTT